MTQYLVYSSSTADTFVLDGTWLSAPLTDAEVSDIKESFARGEEAIFVGEDVGYVELIDWQIVATLAEIRHVHVVDPALGDCPSAEYPAMMARLEKCLDRAAEGAPYTFEVRAARRGEAEGTYIERPSGRLQILGDSVETPEELQTIMDRGWELFCDNTEVTP